MSSEETPEANKPEEEVKDATPAAAAETAAPAETPAAEETAAVPADEAAAVPAEDATATPAKEAAAVPAKEAAAVPAKEAPAATEIAPAEAPAAADTAPAEKDDTIRSSTYDPSSGEGGSFEPEGPVVTERVVTINRCAKVVKGGRRFSFSALVVAGDHDGNVGYGFGKANEVAECIRKASESAKTKLESIERRGTTIPHETIGQFGGGKVLLRPATPGTGIIAGSSVRAVVEAAGITDILTKSLGSNNHFNVVKATLEGLRSLRTKDQVYKQRGKKIASQKAL
jgi:small subunit ribosomal protein S5